MTGSISVPIYKPVWLFFETLIWVLTMAVTAFVVSIVAALGYLALMTEGGFEGSVEQALVLLDNDGIFAAIHVLVLGSCCSLLLLGIVRVQQLTQVPRVLGLVIPGRWLGGAWVAVTCLLLLAEYGLVAALEQPVAPEPELTHFRQAPGLTLLTALIIAPLWEEVVFRGYLHSCFARSVIGPAGAVVLTSALWSMGHLQANSSQLLSLFVTGLVLGFARHSSGSSLLPAVMHAIINGAVIWHLQYFID